VPRISILGVDIDAVRFRERRAFDEENILSVELETCSLYIPVRPFAVFADETVDLSAKEEVRRKN
jgi:hypothetical protein